MMLFKCKERIWFLFFLVVYFSIRCFYLDAVPRWDAGSYWKSLEQAMNATLQVSSLSALPSVIMDNYNAYGHPSMGYFGLLVLGQLFDYPNLFALNMTNLLLAMVSVISVYYIFQWYLPDKKNSTDVLLATAAYAFNPLFFGSSIFLNTDFPVMVFFTTSVACLLYGRYLLFLISNVLLIFSKEPGVLLWAFLMAGAFLVSLSAGWKHWKLNKKVSIQCMLPPYNQAIYPQHWALVTAKLFSLFLPGLIFKAYSIAQKGAMWVGGSGLSWNSQGTNCFGINSRVVANRAGEMFILNFNWVLVLVTLAAFCIAVGRYLERKLHSQSAADFGELATHKPFSEGHLWSFWPLGTAFVAFVAFNLTYITYIIPRYVVVIGFFLVLFMLVSLVYAVYSRVIRLGILGVVVLLLTAQTFRTVDPVSKWLFGTAPFGKQVILQIDNPGEAVGNGFVYNSEFTAIDKLFNLMQRAMPMSKDTVLIAWHSNHWFPWFSMLGVVVDANTLERTIDWRNGFPYNVIDINALQNSQAPAEAYYVYMPWLSVFSNEQSELARLSQIYSISSPTEVGYMGYSLRFYKLLKH